MSEFYQSVRDRLIRYARVNTQSGRNTGRTPTTERQFDLARMLLKELQEIGVDAGLDAEEIREVLSSDKYKDEVLLDEREAARYGIHAVPFFVVGQYGISGAQSVDGMKATIMKVLEEEAEPIAEQGMTCGPDGCHIG